jgi:hypothetical protein
MIAQGYLVNVVDQVVVVAGRMWLEQAQQGKVMLVVKELKVVLTEVVEVVGPAPLE